MPVLLDLAVVLCIGGIAYLVGLVIHKQYEIAQYTRKLSVLKEKEKDWVLIAQDPTDDLYRYKDDYIIVREIELSSDKLQYELLGTIAAKKHYERFMTPKVDKNAAFGDWYALPYRVEDESEKQKRMKNESTAYQMQQPRVQL